MWKAKTYQWLLALTGVFCCGRLCAQPDVNPLPVPGEYNRADSNILGKANANTTPFVIGEIVVEGNKKTKPYIITRELPFKTGDSIYLPELVKGFEVSRQQLMNTALFNDVIVSLKAFRGYAVDIRIEVKERWYIFPIPYIKPVDRNLQEFIKQGVGVDRLNYGFKFTYNNFTGRNDKLKIWLITGYTRQTEFLYEQPYADKTLKHGYKIGFQYSSNKEINYATVNNEQKFTDTIGKFKRWYARLEYTYRPGLRIFHSVRLGFIHQEIDSLVLALNPKYFGSAKTRIFYPELQYQVNYYKVDYIPYPLTGWMAEASFLKRGVSKDMNMWQFVGKLNTSRQIGKKLWMQIQTQGVLRFPYDQPYINQRLFGFGDLYLRGQEDYVVDGMAGFLLRQTVRRQLFKFNINTHLKSRSHSSIPFTFYAKVFGDMGYSHNPVNPENSLTNRMLYTTGFGIDMVTFYDFIIRADYSFNQLGQNGLFLHIKSDF